MKSTITIQIKPQYAGGMMPALLATVILLIGMVSSVRAGNGGAGNPGVLPPQSHPYGKSYAEWSAEHWKWTYSLPADAHPLTDTAGADTGQSGPVWFLGGTWAPTTDLNGNLVGIADRAVTVPAGKALFFPIVNAEASVAEGNGLTETELRDFANFLADHAVGLTCTIDDRPVNQLDGYRVTSPLFEFGPLPDANLLGLPAGTTSPAVSDGYFLMLAPLSSGEHVVHFAGAIVFTAAEDGFDFSFTLDITYRITISP